MKKIEAGINGIWKEKLTAEELITFLRHFQNNESDWKISLYKEFQKNSEEVNNTPQEISRETRILASIHDKILAGKTIVENSPVRRRIPAFMKWAVAASILLVTGLWLWKNETAVEPATILTEQIIIQQEEAGRWEINNTAADLRLVTEDSSIIILSAGSSVYIQMDSPDKRQIHLEGKARFDVKKDKKRPFSVEANGIITTALGTVFTVDGASSSHKVNVRLYEGKVSVRPTDKSKKIKELYLNPGEQCFINTTENKSYVTLIPSKIIVSPSAPEINTINIPIEKEELNLSLAFDKTPLINVFNRLEFIYNISLEYNKQDVREMLFTGEFMSGDSADHVLQVIANMNGLTLLKQNNSYKIIKHHTSEEFPPLILNEKKKDSSRAANPEDISYQQHLPYTILLSESPFSHLYLNIILFNDYA